MEQLGIVMSLFGVLFLAIIGVYVWTYKVAYKTNEQLGKMYAAMNGHIQKAAIHVDKKELVNGEVCKVVHENVTKILDEIKTDVKSLLAKS